MEGYYDQLYRMPDNKLSFVDNFDKIERYMRNGQWSGETGLIRKLIDESVTGDFSPASDEISLADAVALQLRIDAATDPALK